MASALSEALRQAAEQEKRARVLSEEDQCPFCLEPLDAADKNGVRECPECWTKFDRSVKDLHL
jgi:protein-arginine kinase activator protein McsA